jgi:hypothetical protein
MSLYKNPSGGNCTGICTHVSFNRPYDPTTQNLWDYELPLLHFLEQRGYDVSYTTDVDTDRDPGELLRHRLVIVAGHDEYWTKAMRDGFEQAQALGTNLAFLGANIGHWQIRYASDRRTIIEYRQKGLDPEPDPALKTDRFRSLIPPRPECELEGVESYRDEQTGAFSIGGPYDYSINPAALNDPWFAGSGFTATSRLLGLVGYEWDKVVPGCRTPAPTVLFQYRGPPVAADAVRYTASSGARVFSAGSLNFTHGLDDFTPHTTAKPPGDPRLERFMQNALADLQRPAPPTSVQTTALGPHATMIRIKRHPDPRVTAVLVYRGRRLLCTSLRHTCTDHRPPPTPTPYTVVLRDHWATSTPALSPTSASH